MAGKKEKYISLSASLRAKETKLLNAEKAERMIDAPSFEDACKILSECGYGDMSGLNAGEINSAIQEHRKELFDSLELEVPDPELISVFRAKYDCHNAKTVLKAEATGADPLPVMSPCGSISPEQFVYEYSEGLFSELPGKIGEVLENAKSVLSRTANPQLADFVLDKAYYAEIKETAEKLESSFLKGYAEILIDSANLRTAVRTVRMNKDREFLKTALISGGKTDEGRVLNASESGDALAALYKSSYLEKAARLGADAMQGGTLTEFESACDNAVTAYIKNTKLVPYGIEVPASYLAACESEMTAAGMILTGRLAGIGADTLKERLRDFYA